MELTIEISSVENSDIKIGTFSVSPNVDDILKENLDISIRVYKHNFRNYLKPADLYFQAKVQRTNSISVELQEMYDYMYIVKCIHTPVNDNDNPIELGRKFGIIYNTDISFPEEVIGATQYNTATGTSLGIDIDLDTLNYSTDAQVQQGHGPILHIPLTPQPEVLVTPATQEASNWIDCALYACHEFVSHLRVNRNMHINKLSNTIASLRYQGRVLEDLRYSIVKKTMFTVSQPITGEGDSTVSIDDPAPASNRDEEGSINSESILSSISEE